MVDLEKKLDEVKWQNNAQERLAEFNEQREKRDNELSKLSETFKLLWIHHQIIFNPHASEIKEDWSIWYAHIINIENRASKLFVLTWPIEWAKESESHVNPFDHLCFHENWKVYYWSISAQLSQDPIFETWKEWVQEATKIAAKNNFLWVTDETWYIKSEHYDRAYTQPYWIDPTYPDVAILN